MKNVQVTIPPGMALETLYISSGHDQNQWLTKLFKAVTMIASPLLMATGLVNRHKGSSHWYNQLLQILGATLSTDPPKFVTVDYVGETNPLPNLVEIRPQGSSMELCEI